MKHLLKRSISIMLSSLLLAMALAACAPAATASPAQNATSSAVQTQSETTQEITNPATSAVQTTAAVSSAESKATEASITTTTTAVSTEEAIISSASPKASESTYVTDDADDAYGNDTSDYDSSETQKDSDYAETQIAPANDSGLRGAEAALADDDLELAEMITYTLEDEYLARDTYISVMNAFGETRPFVNIKASEETHIELALPLFEEFNVPLPDYVPDTSPFPGTLNEAYQAGVDAEILNIDMYQKFLLQPNLPQSFIDVIEKLEAASQKHLAAFKRRL